MGHNGATGVQGCGSVCFCSLVLKLFGELVCVHGMLVCLPAEFVSSQVIFLTMGDRRGRMVVGRKVCSSASRLWVLCGIAALLAAWLLTTGPLKS